MIQLLGANGFVMAEGGIEKWDFRLVFTLGEIRRVLMEFESSFFIAHMHKKEGTRTRKNKMGNSEN